ncbi:prostatic steroid-binding protein C2-like [Grammomys surdaster]|uniref:prostatic steroid-binding protein C2-like n=1 Tax=Grammomys surdaster TaxID=491861 RepID=UPI00109F5471|nr:prostatic steroid-binding protein C2-like [Grammomys surdaster]
MKLSLCLILIILVVCCYEANAGQACQAVEREIISFLLNSEKELKKELEKYNAPPEAVEANLKVKRCVDKIIYGDRFSIGIELVKVLFKCELQPWLQMNFPVPTAPLIITPPTIHLTSLLFSPEQYECHTHSTQTQKSQKQPYWKDDRIWSVSEDDILVYVDIKILPKTVTIYKSAEQGFQLQTTS